MSVTSEPVVSGQGAVDAAASSDVPSTTNPDSVKAGLDGQPMVDDLKSTAKELEDAKSDLEPDEDGKEPDPAKESKALDTVTSESDRMRNLMMQQNMRMKVNGADEVVKAIIKLLQSIMALILRKKNTPTSDHGDPALAAKRDAALNSTGKTESVLNDVQKDLVKEKQEALDNALDNDGPSPSAPGSKGSAPAAS